MLLSQGTHSHCGSWGRAWHGAPGGDLFLSRVEDPFIRYLGAMMTYTSNTKSGRW